ncbi:MAG: ATP-binding protein [Firmicutes bacterium]|nr:ATP-binding protein [Bacillota bacterium]
MNFVNREKELLFLEDEYKSERSSFVVIYGRRRVGKTALISEFIKNKKALYFFANEEKEDVIKRLFKEKVADFIGDENFKNLKTDDWEKIFKKLPLNTEEKFILIIDEFQNIGKSNSAFPSIFQGVWDMNFEKKNIMVILCGSIISMMESQTLNYASPLYGRRTGQIKLKQIGYTHYAKFFKNFKTNLNEFYAVTGGVPKYIELFVGEEDIYKAIEKNVLNKSKFLYDEPNFLLRQEVSEVGTYFSILRCIAMGNHKLGKISSFLQVKEANIKQYLKILTDLDVLERETPVTEDFPEKSKKCLYKISDNFLRFWFKFVFPNMDSLELGNTDLVMKKIRKNFVDKHVSYVYEDICRLKMWDIKDEHKFKFNKIGRWWDQNTEIDLIALDSDGEEIVFGECKYWKDKKLGSNVFTELKTKAKKVKWKNGMRKERFVLFSKCGFTDEILDLAKKEKLTLIDNSYD